MSKNILIVEDSAEDQEVLHALFSKNCVVESATNISVARNKLERGEYQVVLLDLGLPDGSGFDLLTEFSTQFKRFNTSVVVISGYQEHKSKIHAFQLDVDQYITKPVSPAELSARVDSIFRKKTALSETKDIKRFGNIAMNLVTQRVTLHTNSILQNLYLTPLEYRILVFLSERLEQIKSRIEIVKGVWGDNINVVDRAVDTHICNLRKKLIGSTYNVETELNSGYVLKKR